MRPVTLCLLIRDDEILLAMKKRGFGEGRWNGVGGKLEPNESIEEAAIRETTEEINVVPNSLEKVGDIKFYFKNKPDWNQHVHIFVIKKWSGEPEETDEMKPQWYKHTDIPFDDMWPDDIHWLPKILEGKKIQGVFYFKDEGNTFDNFEITEI